jgi:hypothetical protein
MRRVNFAPAIGFRHVRSRLFSDDNQQLSARSLDESQVPCSLLSLDYLRGRVRRENAFIPAADHHGVEARRLSKHRGEEIHKGAHASRCPGMSLHECPVSFVCARDECHYAEIRLAKVCPNPQCRFGGSFCHCAVTLPCATATLASPGSSPHALRASLGR